MVAEADTEVAKAQEATEEEVAAVAGAGAGGSEEAVGAGVAGGWGPAPT